MALPSYAMNVSSFPEMYERWLVEPLFQPWAEVLLDLTRLRAGDRVVDIACGTGIVARTARKKLGPDSRVVGVDVSPQMLAVARSVEPGVEWREGNAAALPCGNGETFDVVACQQGLQFFPDKPAAAREMRRVLAPGGRVAVATWRPIDEAPIFRDLHHIAERHLGTLVDARHSFGESGPLAQLLTDAGFSEVKVETMSKPVRFDDPSLFLRLNTMALVGMSSLSKTMTEEKRAQTVTAIVAEGEAVVPDYTGANGFEFDIKTNIATGRG